MNIIQLFRSFQTEEQALEYLEKVRWNGHVVCPYCEHEGCGQHPSGDRRHRRWQCWKCRRAFSVKVGTIFHRTHMPLRDWFMVIALMVNAKKSLSAYQVARDTGIRRPTAWSMMQRIRAAMASDQAPLLRGIVEADETYVGGRPRYPTNRRGRGTDKVPVLGVVERGGKVATTVSEDVKGRSILAFIKGNVDPEGSHLISDEFRAYRTIRQHMPHSVINHRRGWVDGPIHTNTIEGFWSLIKRAWYGSHHHYSKRFMPLYVAEATWKYNHRKDGNAFSLFLQGCFA
jgi:transposase-like protein